MGVWVGKVIKHRKNDFSFFYSYPRDGMQRKDFDYTSYTKSLQKSSKETILDKVFVDSKATAKVLKKNQFEKSYFISLVKSMRNKGLSAKDAFKVNLLALNQFNDPSFVRKKTKYAQEINLGGKKVELKAMYPLSGINGYAGDNANKAFSPPIHSDSEIESKAFKFWALAMFKNGLLGAKMLKPERFKQAFESRKQNSKDLSTVSRFKELISEYSSSYKYLSSLATYEQERYEKELKTKEPIKIRIYPNNESGDIEDVWLFTSSASRDRIIKELQDKNEKLQEKSDKDSKDIDFATGNPLIFELEEKRAKLDVDNVAGVYASCYGTYINLLPFFRPEVRKAKTWYLYLKAIVEYFDEIFSFPEYLNYNNAGVFNVCSERDRQALVHNSCTYLGFNVKGFKRLVNAPIPSQKVFMGHYPNANYRCFLFCNVKKDKNSYYQYGLDLSSWFPLATTFGAYPLFKLNDTSLKQGEYDKKWNKKYLTKMRKYYSLLPSIEKRRKYPKVGLKKGITKEKVLQENPLVTLYIPDVGLAPIISSPSNYVATASMDSRFKTYPIATGIDYGLAVSMDYTKMATDKDLMQGVSSTGRDSFKGAWSCITENAIRSYIPPMPLKLWQKIPYAAKLAIIPASIIQDNVTLWDERKGGLRSFAIDAIMTALAVVVTVYTAGQAAPVIATLMITAATAQTIGFMVKYANGYENPNVKGSDIFFKISSIAGTLAALTSFYNGFSNGITAFLSEPKNLVYLATTAINWSCEVINYIQDRDFKDSINVIKEQNEKITQDLKEINEELEQYDLRWFDIKSNLDEFLDFQLDTILNTDPIKELEKAYNPMAIYDSYFDRFK